MRGSRWHARDGWLRAQAERVATGYHKMPRIRANIGRVRRPPAGPYPRRLHFEADHRVDTSSTQNSGSALESNAPTRHPLLQTPLAQRREWPLGQPASCGRPIGFLCPPQAASIGQRVRMAAGRPVESRGFVTMQSWAIRARESNANVSGDSPAHPSGNLLPNSRNGYHFTTFQVRRVIRLTTREAADTRTWLREP